MLKSVLIIRKFSRGFYFRETLHMRSFTKIKSSEKGEIILSFTDIGKSSPSREFLKLQRTSDSFNEGLPIKIARQKFQRKRLFFHQKDSRLNSRIIRKSIFLIRQASIQKYGLKILFLLFNI